MIKLNDILTDNEIQNPKKERLIDFLTSLSIYDLFSKYSFEQGARLIDKEKKLLEQISINIRNRINKIGKLELRITLTNHNPYYFTFFDIETSLHYNIEDFDELIKDAIYNKIEPYFKEEVNIILKKIKADALA